MTAPERSWTPDVRCESCGREVAEVEITLYGEHQGFRLCVRCGQDCERNAWPAVRAVEWL